mmetsp:Transcript_45255/g.119561  ORF Transcript_45255/g.119561 Transcript_45255/m.119561 type:complete len:200 (+) Transcript_45255:1659-2258(+)
MPGVGRQTHEGDGKALRGLEHGGARSHRRRRERRAGEDQAGACQAHPPRRPERGQCEEHAGDAGSHHRIADQRHHRHPLAGGFPARERVRHVLDAGRDTPALLQAQPEGHRGEAEEGGRPHEAGEAPPRQPKEEGGEGAAEDRRDHEDPGGQEDSGRDQLPHGDDGRPRAAAAAGAAAALRRGRGGAPEGGGRQGRGRA